MWETILIVIIGLSAAGYLVWFLLLSGKKDDPCSRCPSSRSCRRSREDCRK